MLSLITANIFFSTSTVVIRYIVCGLLITLKYILMFSNNTL
jgi:hypothetical protein